jgi:hypothetical protein
MKRKDPKIIGKIVLAPLEGLLYSISKYITYYVIDQDVVIDRDFDGAKKEWLA